MRIMLLCRFQKSNNDPIFQEIEDALDLQELTENNFNREKERDRLLQDKDIYDYAPLMFEVKDVCTANYVDPQHTSLRMYNNNNFTVKLGFIDFIQVYEQLSGYTVTDFRDIKIVHEALPPIEAVVE